MANKVQWDATPTPADVFATGAGLKNATPTATLVAAADVANGTTLNTHADFLLYIKAFDADPHAGDYIQIHLIYKFGVGKYGDGEHGDVANPALSNATLHHQFLLSAAAGPQFLQALGVPILPYDFRVVLKLAITHDLTDENDHYMQIATYCLEVQ